MKNYNQFLCPQTGENLKLEIVEGQPENIILGYLKTGRTSFMIKNNIINLSYPEILDNQEKEIISWYEKNYLVYDDFLPITFETFNVNEMAERCKMISHLNIQPTDKVLETGAGTGRDSAIIAKHLSKGGEFHVTDIFEDILILSQEKLVDCEADLYFSVVNAIHLPYPDNYFDKYYHFGGWNTFSDKRKAFEEVHRVVKPGGKIIIGDESIPPWLRDSEFAKILINSNPHYSFPLPLNFMHYSARNVSINYVMGGVFYYISYENGEGYPYSNFDIPIPGLKGGTLNTRYYGKLEGVSKETFDLAIQAIHKSGKSSFTWLNETIETAAKTALKNLKH